MKITIVNTTDIRGGAAIAAFRLFKALRDRLPETKMLVSEKLTDTANVVGHDNSSWQRLMIKFRFYLERISFILRSDSRDGWFAFSPANTGRDISRHPDIQNADIIHLHWINGGYLSLSSLKKLIKTGKPIVWTLQDMWAFTGGCHYTGTCTNFERGCGDCKYLKFRSGKDLSSRIHRRKMKIFSSGNINFIGSSNWMAESARRSSLAGKSKVTVLPNPIEIEIYKPADKNAIRDRLGLPRDKFLILSGAANFKDKRKGFHYLLQALRLMAETHPEISGHFGLITFGKSSDVNDSPITVYPQAYLKDDNEIAQLYQAADVFVLPTLEDNLPSTVIESLACGTPVVAFNTGGIPDMVDHKSNGYLAELRNTEDIVSGISWVENHPDLNRIRENCRTKVVLNFSPEVVATKYMSFYRTLIQ